MGKTKIRPAHLALGAALVFVFTGALSCESIQEPFNDAPRSSATFDGPADIITMPDGFSNWATKCVQGSRIFAAYHGEAPYASGFAIPNDPTCPKPAPAQ